MALHKQRLWLGVKKQAKIAVAKMTKRKRTR